MDIEVEWLQPIVISRSSRGFHAGIARFELDGVPDGPGIYAFARRYGRNVEPLYVGKAENLRRRMKQQLNNYKLMQAVADSKIGARVLLVAKVRPKGGQQLGKVLTVAERAYIRAALSQGFEIVNKQGTRERKHEIRSVGRHSRQLPFARVVFAE